VNLRIYIQSQEEEKLATHGSHEITIGKNKRKILDNKRASRDLLKDTPPMFNLASLL